MFSPDVTTTKSRSAKHGNGKAVGFWSDKQVKTSTDEEEQVELYKKMETLLCDDATNLYIEDMACEVALRSDFAGYRFYPLYVQDMAKIYKVK